MRLGVLAALARRDEHLDGAPLLLAVARPGDAFLQLDEALETLLDDLLGDWSSIVAAGVPGRIEYWNVNAELKREASTTSRVPWKSSSVSPGKPTMMSVVIAASGIFSRTFSMMPRNFLLR